MHLTLHSDYSLRVLIYLAAHADRLVSTQEISEAYLISHNHLVKVVHELGKSGFLQIKRGRAGGLSLSRPAKEIGVGEVVRAMEPHFNIAECFAPESNDCPIVPVCGFQTMLHEATDAFFAVLDGHTLADIMGSDGVRRYKRHFLNSGKD